MYIFIASAGNQISIVTTTLPETAMAVSLREEFIAIITSISMGQIESIEGVSSAKLAIFK